MRRAAGVAWTPRRTLSSAVCESARRFSSVTRSTSVSDGDSSLALSSSMRWRSARARLRLLVETGLEVADLHLLRRDRAERREAAERLLCPADGHAQVDHRAAAARARRAVVDRHDGAAEGAHGVEHALRRARELGDAADREPQRGGVVLCALPVGQRRGGRRVRAALGAPAARALPARWRRRRESSQAAKSPRRWSAAAAGCGSRRAVTCASASRRRRRSRPRRRRRPSTGARRSCGRRRRRRGSRRGAGAGSGGAVVSERTRSRSSAGRRDLADGQLVEQRADAALAAVGAGLAAQQRLEPVGCDRVRRAHGTPPPRPAARARERVASCTRSA